MKRVVVWDSKNNLYVNKYKKIYISFAVIFAVLLIIASVSFICIDWNDSGSRFDLEDIFIGLFFNTILLFFFFMGYIQIKLGLEALKYDEKVILTYYPMKEIKKYGLEINPKEVVFSDSNCIITSNDRRGYDILSILFSLKSYFDFEDLFNYLEKIEE